MYKREWTVCACARVCAGRDYVMECAGGRVESGPVRRVGCSLLSTVLRISLLHWRYICWESFAYKYTANAID